MSLGTRLRQFIKLNGMTVRQFEKATEIPYRSIHEYLSDKRKPGAEHLAKMIDAGVDIEWLLTGKEKHGINFLFSDIEHLGPIGGFVIADIELRKKIFFYAVNIVDEVYSNEPEFTKSSGLIGAIISVWWLMKNLADTLNKNEEQIVRMREAGISVHDVLSVALDDAKPRLIDYLRSSAK